jgi:hypothetical protein
MGQGKELGMGLSQGLPPNTLKTRFTYTYILCIYAAIASITSFNLSSPRIWNPSSFVT